MRSGVAAALGASWIVAFAASTRAEGAAPPAAETVAPAPSASAPAAPVPTPVPSAASAPATPSPTPAPSAGAASAPASSTPALVPNASVVSAPASPSGEAALRDAVREDAENLAKLEQRVARDEAEAAQRPRLSGYVQIDWLVHDQASQNQIDFSTGLPENQDRFTLRRGHVRVDAERGILSGALEIDANTTNGPQVRPIDAEVSLKWPAERDPRLPDLLLTAGLMKIPFGFEVPELDNVRPFLERSTVMRALFPGEFDLGARARIRYRGFELAVAVMNGNPIGDRVFPALAPLAAKEIVGRLGTGAELVRGVRFDAGVSADTGSGFHEGTPTTKDQVVWRDENGDGIVQATEIQVIPGSSATASQTFHRFAIGGDVRLRLEFSPGAALSLRAEIVRSENLDRGIEPADPVGAGYGLRELGYYVGATQEITKWALVGVRYDHYDPDQDAREQQAIQVVPVDRSYGTLALLAMFRCGLQRLSIEYDKNWNALGRDQNGAPTTLKSDALTVRAQAAF